MLEQRIEELTAAVKALTDMLNNHPAIAGTPHVETRDPEVKHVVKAADIAPNRRDGEGTKDTKERLEREGVPNAKSEEKPQTISPTSEPTEPESAPVTYDDVKKVTIALSKISKDQAIGALAKFGVASAKQLVETQWGSYVDFVNGVLQDA